MLNSLTNNKYAVKESFPFTKETVEQGSGFFMESLDVHFFFTTTVLEENINICYKNLLKN